VKKGFGKKEVDVVIKMKNQDGTVVSYGDDLSSSRSEKENIDED
jgi:hypothetical protein